MTLLEKAKKNISSDLIHKISKAEGVKTKFLLQQIKAGRIVIPANINHPLELPCGIGYKLKTKVNANIGTSTDESHVSQELKKLKVAVASGADTIMDLSVGGDLKAIRKLILKNSPVPVGTVPIYEIAVLAQENKNDFLEFDFRLAMDVLEEQAKEGVDFFTIHAGITKNTVRIVKGQKRVMGIVSRGGAMLASWISRHKKENPFFEYFDHVLDIAAKYDVTLSLGDGLRPGSILDATDKAQIAELKTLGVLAQRAKKRNVQVMIEGPGHVPINQVVKNIELEKKICDNAPFYVLGPLVTDVACGYDHITAAIGGALAASVGADFLCYVTASEHLRHPTIEDVKEGVIASKIAAHAGDIAKNIPSAILWDKKMSEARQRRDWKTQIKLSIDPLKAKRLHLSSRPNAKDVCTMCGKYCSMKMMEECSK